MGLRAFQFFSLAMAVSLFPGMPLSGALSVGQRYRLNFVDVDGNALSTADGHVTVLVLTTTADREKARAVGERVPDYCLGNPNYRMITILDFTRRHTQIGREIATMLVRHHLNEEAKRLQARYEEKKIARDARRDILTVTDFDGTVSSQLSGQSPAANFRVFVFARNGELLQQWDDVPSAAELAAVVKEP
ncbi:MAG: hypothetical protein AUH91_04235 [Verrucomicrobia bacterium 13_1_40CM_4_54_4]|nr:MAG: hypothetical protein AUH91_04235 [Verrucomicrobia bacterium 13_1_40CM_4_54_4]